VKPRELFRRLNVLQKSRGFKIGASAVVLALAIGGFIALWVTANAPGAAERIAASQENARESRPVGQFEFLEHGPVAVMRDAVDAALVSLSTPEGVPAVAIAFAAVAGAAITVTWFGLGLTYLGLLSLGWLVAWPLATFESTRGLGQLLLALVPLALAFLMAMEVLRLALSGPWPVMAIARNVLAEAVRMKISLVFIVILLLFLSSVPGMLNENQPLRYRVQQWLSYGTGLSYAVLALLTAFFSAATVAFEQRDRTIWQTMTKPVTAWEYLLGKWIGVMGLNAVLLTVTATGVFLFTEYLRHLPAAGEMRYHVREDGVSTHDNPGLMTEDRRLLETGVLVARASVQPDAFEVKQEEIEMEVSSRVADLRAREPDIVISDRVVNEIRSQVALEWSQQHRSTDPGAVSKPYVFSGLGGVRKAWSEAEKIIEPEVQRRVAQRPTTAPPLTDDEYNQLYEAVAMELLGKGVIKAPPTLTLRYKINAGTNNPTHIFRLRFSVNDYPFDREVALKSAQTLTFPASLIDEQGKIVLLVGNYPQNPDPISFPPDGLEILYAAGGYELNFVRVMTMMWIKLAFIAAVAIAAATLLSFPVACLVALAILFTAESAGFLSESLESYLSVKEGRVNWFAVVVRAISVPVAWTFRTYADLKPSTALVEGRLLSWLVLARAAMVLGIWSAVAFLLGWATFRRRELALYSGH